MSTETFPPTVWVVHVQEGKYGDMLPVVVRSTLRLARAWCEEHALLHGCKKVFWDYDDQGIAVKLDGAGDNFSYMLESLPFK